MQGFCHGEGGVATFRDRRRRSPPSKRKLVGRPNSNPQSVSQPQRCSLQSCRGSYLGHIILSMQLRFCSAACMNAYQQRLLSTRSIKYTRSTLVIRRGKLRAEFSTTVGETTLISPLHDDRRADLGATIQVDDVIIGHANTA